MRQLLAIILVCLFAIPNVGFSKPKTKILHPPVLWIEHPASGGVQGLYLEHYIDKVMNIMMVPDDSTNVDILVRYSEDDGFITAKLESGDTAHPVYKALRLVLDSLPRFYPTLSVNMETMKYKDSLRVSVKHRPDTTSKIVVSVKGREVFDLDVDPMINNNGELAPTDGNVLPKFQDGDFSEFCKWVFKNIIYPEPLYLDNFQGKVIVRFMVDSNGYVDPYFEAVQTPHVWFFYEVIRVLRKSPRWTPGYKDGKAINVKYTIPVEFRIL